MAVVFAREITPPLASLVKKLDESTIKNAGCQMGSFVVLLTDNQDAMAKQLKDLAQKEHLKNVELTVFDRSGPSSYHINKETDVTVLLYVDKQVKANFAYRKGEFQEKDIDRVLADLQQILPKN